MPQKYLTFLGTNDYQSCTYYFKGENENRKQGENENQIENIRFVQEATIQFNCMDWTDDGDKIIVFLTEEARRKNWQNDGHTDRKTGKTLFREGLKTRLKALPPPCPVCPVDIRTGKSEAEIWKNFETVLAQLDEGDRVILDITHAFRSIPMLAVVLLNYAKAAKDIHVAGIYYGAFEAGKPPDTGQEDRRVPIFDLTSFDELMDWSAAVDRFFTAGDAASARRLTDETIRPALKASRGRDAAAAALRNVAKAMEQFARNMTTCRGPEIGPSARHLREQIEKCTGLNLPHPFEPLLKKLRGEAEKFGTDEVRNGVAAARWCLDRNLIQQGYTILKETLISFLVREDQGDVLCLDARELADQALNIQGKGTPQDEWKSPAKDKPEIIRRHMKRLTDDQNLQSFLNSLKDHRNDINHAGYRKESRTPDRLRKKLVTVQESVERYFSDGPLSADAGEAAAGNPALFLLFNHTATSEQKADARASLGVDQVIPVSGKALDAWGEVPPDMESIDGWLDPVRDWLKKQAAPGDYVLIQGDFGACRHMVNFCFENGWIPVYATTAREALEEKQPDGSVRMTHHFRHRRFRRYER